MPILINASAPDRSGWCSLRFPFNRALVDLLKQVPGSWWDKAASAWRVSHHGLAVLAPLIKSSGLGVVSAQPSRQLECPPLYTNPGHSMRPYQLDAYARMSSRTGYALTFDPRVGKGQRSSDVVMTPTGPKRFDSLVVGDLVFGRDGKPYPLEGVFRRGKMPVWRVSFHDGTSLDVSGDHLWDVQFYVWRRAARSPNKWVTKTTEELSREALFDSEGAARWFIPMTAPVEMELGFQPSPWRPIDPYVLGALLGDGHFGKSITITPGDLEVPAAIRSRGVELSPRKKIDKRAQTYFVPRMAAHISALGLKRTRAWTKFVPLIYLYAPSSVRLDVLRGLLDTDGSFEANTTIFCSTSAQLANDVVFLVQSLGGTAKVRSRVPTYTYKGQKKNGRRAYYVTISLDAELSGCGKQRSAARSKFFPSRAIVKIERLDEEDEIICIKTSAPDQLYVTSNFIVTHNTFPTVAVIAQALAERRAERVIVFYPASIKEEWQVQLAKFANLTLTLTGGQDMPDEDQVVVWASQPWLVLGVHYEILGFKAPAEASEKDGPQGLLALAEQGKYIVVADEIQNIRNRNAPRTKVLLQMSAHPNCVGRYALTGTPMRNRPRDLWVLFEFLQPGSVGGYWKFCQRYAGAHQGQYGWVDKGSTNEEELNTRLNAVSYRLRRADVAAYLPKSDRRVFMCSLNEPVRKEYDAAARELSATGVLTNALSESEPSAGTMRALEHLSAITTKAKLTTLVERVAFHAIDRGVKVLVFANFHDSLKQVWDVLDPSCGMQDVPEGSWGDLDKKKIKKPLGAVPVFCAAGWMTSDKRYKTREQWKACPGPAVLLANTMSSGVGIDLSDADAAIFIELCWVPADFNQAESRIIDIHLGKRTTPPLFEYLLTRGTIDSDMGLALIEKVQNIEAVVGHDESLSQMANTLRGSGVVDVASIALNKADPAAVATALSRLRDRLLGRVSDPSAKGQAALAVGLEEVFTEDEEKKEGDDDDDDPEAPAET